MQQNTAVWGELSHPTPCPFPFPAWLYPVPLGVFCPPRLYIPASIHTLHQYLLPGHSVHPGGGMLGRGPPPSFELFVGGFLESFIPRECPRRGHWFWVGVCSWPHRLFTPRGRAKLEGGQSRALCSSGPKIGAPCPGPRAAFVLLAVITVREIHLCCRQNPLVIRS